MLRAAAFGLSLALLTGVGVCLAPAEARADPEEEAIAHVKAAQEAAQGGDHKKAIKEYEAGFKLLPNPNLLIAIALEWRELGNGHNARASLRKFLKEAPADHKRRGEAKALLNKFESEKAGDKGGAKKEDEATEEQPAVEAAPAATGGKPAAAAAPAAEGAAQKEGEAAPAAEAPTEFTPESVSLQLDDSEKPIGARKAARKAPDAALGLPTKELAPAAEVEAPIYKKWWFWVVAAAVVGGIVAVGVVVSQPAGASIHPCPTDVVGCYGEGR